MELDAYLRAFRRWWFIPVAVLGLTLAGVWMYHNITGTKEAQATVVVLQPYYAGPGEFVTPQIGFDSVDEGGELAQRVAARLDDGTEPGDLNISIDIISNLNRPNPSLLYGVKAEDKDKGRAIKVADLTVEEATKLFAEINTPSPRDVRAAYEAEISQEQQEVARARLTLVAFEEENGAYSLNDRIDHQMALVSQLRSASILSGAGGGSGGGADTASLSAARSELDRLLRLQSEYNRLAFEVGLPQAAVATLEQREFDLELAGDEGTALLADVRMQLDGQRQRLADAQSSLSAFEVANNASQLPAAVQAQQSMVSQLTVSQAGSAAGTSSLAASLAQEEERLDALLKMKPEYDKLNLELQKAEKRLSTLEDSIIGIEAGRNLPVQADVKVLDNASLQSNLWWQMITYGLGLVLALFVSLTAIYLLGYFQAVPPTIRDLEREFARPVIAHIPKLSD